MGKRGQEEIAGFAALVVLVLIAGVFLLGFWLRQPVESMQTSSSLVRSFLDSSVQTTSSCTLRGEQLYASLADVIRACGEHPERTCGSGEQVCAALNRTMPGLLAYAFPLEGEGAYSGYTLQIHVKDSAPDFYSHDVGNCSRNQMSDSLFLPNKYELVLTLCS